MRFTPPPHLETHSTLICTLFLQPGYSHFGQTGRHHGAWETHKAHLGLLLFPFSFRFYKQRTFWTSFRVSKAFFIVRLSAWWIMSRTQPWEELSQRLERRNIQSFSALIWRWQIGKPRFHDIIPGEQVREAERALPQNTRVLMRSDGKHRILTVVGKWLI